MKTATLCSVQHCLPTKHVKVNGDLLVVRADQLHYMRYTVLATQQGLAEADMHYARWVRKLGGAPPWQVIQVLINKTEGGFTDQMQVSAYTVHSCKYSLPTATTQAIAVQTVRCAPQ
jgi:hypothetical protein